jgi:transcription initiation factor TFIIB
MFPFISKESQETITALRSGLCPSCRGSLVGDPESGEVYCSKCGFVHEDEPLDFSQNGSSFTPAAGSKENLQFSGESGSLSIHDYGLATEIASNSKDWRGVPLEDYQGSLSLRKWNTRLKTPSNEKNLMNALNIMRSATGMLNLPQSVLEDASYIFRKSFRKGTSKWKSIAGMSAASLYLACRRTNVNRSMKEVAETMGVKEKIVSRYFRLIVNELDGVTRMPSHPPTLQSYISKIVNKNKINPKVERVALQLAKSITDNEISDGKAPAGLAAAYIHIASVLSSANIPFCEICESAEVTETTVRNRCKEVLGKYLLRQKLICLEDHSTRESSISQ